MNKNSSIEELKPLFDFIELRVPLQQEDKELLVRAVFKESVQKGERIVELDSRCQSLKFVLSGIYRVFKIQDGNERTSYFNYVNRNPLVASFKSLLTGTLSDETVECIEAGELLTINYKDWLQLYEKSERFNTFGRLMAEYNYLLALERIESLQNQSATDRYDSFLKLYPNLLNLIPHHYIASYVGVAPESLSRIRKELAKDNS